MKRLLFIDTNIYTACAAAELEKLNLDVLSNIKTKLDGGWLLLVPEVIAVEVKKKLRNTFNELRRDAQIPELAQGTPSGKGKDISSEEDKDFKLFKAEKIKKMNAAAIAKANKATKEEFDKSEKEANKLLDSLFAHKNCKTIKLNDAILLKGMKRSALCERPSSVETKKERQHFLRDMDCIAFESLLSGLARHGATEDQIIICTTDPDYFSGGTLHPDILTALKPLTKKQTGYKSILDLLEKESRKESPVKFTNEQKKDYEKVTDKFLVINSTPVGVTADSLKISDSPGLTYSALYETAGQSLRSPLASARLATGGWTRDMSSPFSIARSCQHCGYVDYEKVLTVTGIQLQFCPNCGGVY